MAPRLRRPKPLRVKDLGEKRNNYELFKEKGGIGESLPLNPLPLGYPLFHNERFAYNEATHLATEYERCPPPACFTVIPRPFGPVKLLTLTPSTLLRMLRFPFLGYRKETLRSLRL